MFFYLGTGIFADYQCLMKIWTHPWAVKLEAIRRLEREALDDIRNFLDDSESESESSDEEKVREPGWKSSDSEPGPYCTIIRDAVCDLIYVILLLVYH